MKSFSFITTIIIFLMFDNQIITAQTNNLSINQVELMKNSLGIWQTIVSTDTLEYWDQQQYGKGFIVYAYLVVKGRTIPQHINIFSFDPKIGKFKGYILWKENGFATWMGSFTTGKMYHVDFSADYNPEKVWGTFDMIFTDSTSRKHLHFVNNRKTHEEVFNKVK